jgi:hypothetical protein
MSKALTQEWRVIAVRKWEILARLHSEKDDSIEVAFFSDEFNKVSRDAELAKVLTDKGISIKWPLCGFEYNSRQRRGVLSATMQLDRINSCLPA